MLGLKLRKPIKEKWLKALRSGEYKQGTGQLCEEPYDEDGQYAFCCLGVLTNITEGFNTDDSVYCDGAKYADGYPTQSTFDAVFKRLPEELDRRDNWDEVHVLYKGRPHKLDELNDGGMSFKRIANIIEKQL